MTKTFDPLKDYGTVQPPYKGACYEQNGSYFNGDGKWLFDDEKEPKRKDAGPGVVIPSPDNPDKDRDYSMKRPLHDPNPAPLTEAERLGLSGATVAEIEARYLARLQQQGVLVDDDGLPVKSRAKAHKAEADEADDEAEAKPALPASDGKPPIVTETESPPEPRDYEGVDPKKALKAYLLGELTPPPQWLKVRGWGKEVFAQAFVTKEDLIKHAVEQNFVAAEKVKA